MTRAESSRKHKSRKKHSKLSIMRRKLTLRARVSPVQYVEANNHQEHISNDNSNQEDVIHGGDGHEQALAETQDNVEQELQSTLPVIHKKYFQCASPMKLTRLYPKITPDQKKMIREADYGGLLDIKCSKLQPELCKFLMEHFDASSCSLVFPGRGTIPITEISVRKVLGVPQGIMEVRYDLDKEAIRFMKEQIGDTGRKKPRIATLEKKLISMKKADQKYLRLFITFSMCSVLRQPAEYVSALGYTHH